LDFRISIPHLVYFEYDWEMHHDAFVRESNIKAAPVETQASQNTTTLLNDGHATLSRSRNAKYDDATGHGPDGR
jgi:hypothetical protein